MKKLLFAVLMSLILIGAMGVPVMARGIDTNIVRVHFNFDVLNHSPSEFDGGDWAIEVEWARHPPTIIRAEEFEFQGQGANQETTLAEVEARIKARFDDMLVAKDLLKSFDENDECRQDPPILRYNEEIIVENNQEYLIRHRKYFEIHIYSQDPLKWITQFSKYPIPDNWWPE